MNNLEKNNRYRRLNIHLYDILQELFLRAVKRVLWTWSQPKANTCLSLFGRIKVTVWRGLFWGLFCQLDSRSIYKYSRFQFSYSIKNKTKVAKQFLSILISYSGTLSKEALQIPVLTLSLKNDIYQSSYYIFNIWPLPACLRLKWFQTWQDILNKGYNRSWGFWRPCRTRDASRPKQQCIHSPQSLLSGSS